MEKAGYVMATACCNVLNQYVTSIVGAWESGRDLTEATKQVAGVNALSEEQVVTLCGSVNSAMQSMGAPGSERVSSDTVNKELESLPQGLDGEDSSGKYCDTGPLPGNAAEVMDTLSEIAGSICFYGCFAGALYATSVSRYNNLGEALSDAGTAFTSLMQQMAQSGNRWGTSFQDQLKALSGLVKDIVSASYNSIADAFKGKSWDQIMWSFLKGYGSRYANYIIIGAAQNLVDELNSELKSRSSKYLILDQKLTKLATALEALAGYDWWEEFLAATNKAKGEVARADAALIRAQVGVSTGSWDSKDINHAQARILLAKSSISSVDMITDTIEELFGALKDTDPWSFNWDSARAVRADFLEDLDTLGVILEDMKEFVTCLDIQNKRIDILKALIITLNNTTLATSDLDFLDSSIDVQIDADVVDITRQELRRIHSEMTSVIANEDRVAAPVYLSSWNVSLYALLNGLNLLNAYPATLGLEPLGLSGYVSNTQELSALQNVVDAIENMEEPSGMQFVMSIINNAGNMSQLMTNREAWRDQVGQIRTALRANSSKDNMVSSVCSTFSGNDNEYYDYIVGSLEDLGWNGAKHALERGEVAQFLRMGLFAGAAMFAGLDCFASMIQTSIEAHSGDVGIDAALGEEFNRLQAESIVSIKAPAMLPAFQFDAIISIAGKLRDIQDQITRIASIKDGIC